MNQNATIFINLGQAEGGMKQVEELVRKARDAAVGTDMFEDITNFGLDLKLAQLALQGLAEKAERRYERGPA